MSRYWATAGDGGVRRACPPGEKLKGLLAQPVSAVAESARSTDTRAARALCRMGSILKRRTTWKCEVLREARGRNIPQPRIRGKTGLTPPLFVYTIKSGRGLRSFHEQGRRPSQCGRYCPELHRRAHADAQPGHYQPL